MASKETKVGEDGGGGGASKTTPSSSTGDDASRFNAFGGWLEKTVGGFIFGYSYARRWFVINTFRGELRWFDEKCMHPPAEILERRTHRVRVLKGATVRIGKESSAGKFDFSLDFPHAKTLDLRANTRDERNDWMRELKQAIAVPTTPLPTNSSYKDSEWEVQKIVSQWSDDEWEGDSPLREGNFSLVLNRNRTSNTPEERIRIKGNRIIRFSRALFLETDASISKKQRTFASVWDKISWGIDVVHQIIEIQRGKKQGGPVTASQRKLGFDKRLHVALYSMCSYLQTQGHEAGMREKLVEMFDSYIQKNILRTSRVIEEDDDDDDSGASKKEETKRTTTQFLSAHIQLKKSVCGWEKYKILMELVRRVFRSIDKNLLNICNDGTVDSVSAMAVRRYVRAVFGETHESPKKALTKSKKSKTKPAANEAINFVPSMLEIVHEARTRFHRMSRVCPGDALVVRLRAFDSGATDDTATQRNARANVLTLDVQAARSLRSTVELIQLVGVARDPKFSRVQNFIDVLKANNGCFVVLAKLRLLNAENRDEFLDCSDAKFLGVYQDRFEKPFLVKSQAWFLRLKTEWLGSKLKFYFERVRDTVAREGKFVDSYLNPSTKPKLRKAAWECLVAPPAQQQVLMDPDNGFKSLLESKDIDSLRLIYRIYVEAEKEAPDLFKNVVDAPGKNRRRRSLSKQVKTFFSRMFAKKANDAKSAEKIEWTSLFDGKCGVALLVLIFQDWIESVGKRALLSRKHRIELPKSHYLSSDLSYLSDVADLIGKARELAKNAFGSANDVIV
eukprot:g2121.t1